MSLQGGKEAGKVEARQTGGLPVAVSETEKRLEIEQWQAWITLQQQVRDSTSEVFKVAWTIRGMFHTYNVHKLLQHNFVNP